MEVSETAVTRRSLPLMEAVAAWVIAPDDVFEELGALPGAAVVHAWRVLRLLALCAPDPPPPASLPFNSQGMEALEEAILRADYDEAIRYPLAVLARCLTPGAEPDFERLSWACLCAADWAFTRGGAPGVGRSFVCAAARLSGLASYVEVARRVVAGERPEASGAMRTEAGDREFSP